MLGSFQLAIDDLPFDKLDKIIKNIITSIEYSPENYIKLLAEYKKLEKIKDEYDTFKKTTFKKIMEENNKLKMEYQQLLDNNHSITTGRTRLRKFKKQSDGFYYVHDKKYTKLFGTRQEVWDEVAYKTSGQLTKSDLMVNHHGEIVSKIKS